MRDLSNFVNGTLLNLKHIYTSMVFILLLLFCLFFGFADQSYRHSCVGNVKKKNFNFFLSLSQRGLGTNGRSS